MHKLRVQYRVEQLPILQKRIYDTALEGCSPLTSVGSYCVVFDAVVDMPTEMLPDRLWVPGVTPKTAVWEYLKTHIEFEIDKSIQHKLLITVAPDGYLKIVN